MNFIDVCHAIGDDFRIDGASLANYALEDEIGGFGFFTQWPGGSVWSVEGRILYALVRLFRPQHLVEVGTAAGCSATHMLYGIERNGSMGHLSSVDIEADGFLVPPHLRQWWTMNKGVTGQEFLAKSDIPFDFAYEDASHTFETTREILAAMKAIPTVKVIVSHDARHPACGEQVRQAWTDVFGGAYRTYLAEPSDCGLAVWVRPSERILYLPIIEQGVTHETQFRNKRGLLDALAEYGSVYQLDYLDFPPAELFGAVKKVVEEWKPTILFTQLHSAENLTPDQISELRALRPDMKCWNWSGDHWKHSLTSPAMLELCKRFDMQLVAAIDALPTYAEHGIPAFYSNMAHEKSVGPLPTMPTYDIVFLANAITDRRKQLMSFLKGIDYACAGIYGDWQYANGRNVYDFGQGEALYKNAKIAIADNTYPESCNFMSNRVYQALFAGGAVVFQQHIPRMVEISGLVAGRHFVEWKDLRDLDEKLRYYLDPLHEEERHRIVEAGKSFAQEHHTYRERVKEIFSVFLPQIERRR